MTPYRQCTELCRSWITAYGLPYCRTSREAFARAHPAMCGHAYDVMLRGYERWLVRCNNRDDLDSFARYLSPRCVRTVTPEASPHPGPLSEGEGFCYATAVDG